MSFSSRLKEARKNKGLTQEQLAKEIGVAKSTIAGYEVGTREPDMYKISKIMEVLDIDANYLWQDDVKALKTQKNSPPSEDEEEILKYSTELYNALLSSGIIREGETLSKKQLEFLMHLSEAASLFFDEDD